MHADYLPKDLSLIIIHVYKLSSPEDGPAHDGAYIMSKQTMLFMWIWTCIYSCSPHTHTHIHLQNTQHSLCLRGPDIYEDASSMALWQHYVFLAAASPRYNRCPVPLLHCLRRPVSTSLEGDAGRSLGRHGLAQHPGTERLSLILKPYGRRQAVCVSLCECTMRQAAE